MGFNMSGLAINKNYKNNLKELEEQFNWKLEFVEEVSLETASENYKPDNLADVYFLEQGTLLFLNARFCTEPLSLPNSNTLTFIFNESSMIFSFNYCEKKTLTRSFLQQGNRMIFECGEKLNTELPNKEPYRIIWDHMGEVIGTHFFNIPLDEKAFRYKLLI